MQHRFLDNLGFTTENGLVRNLSDAQNHVERLFFEGTKSFSVKPNAIFFRRFYDSEKPNVSHYSIPSVCIFQKEDNFFNSELHKTLHAEIWSAGNLDIYIILGETRVDVVNARKPAKRDANDVSLADKSLHLASAVIELFESSAYNAHLFGSGTFWEQSEFKDKIDSNSNPYNFLLDYLMEARLQLQRDPSIHLTPVTIDKLLITSILIKFLEEIKDDDGKHTLKQIYKKHNIISETFEEGLRQGLCLPIIEDLASIFNGKIFDTFTDEEKSQLNTSRNLVSIANFLSADINVKTKQGFLWKQYSFKHLPAEVISAIYENFIQTEAARNLEVRKDVVYTPLHLVNLMVDEAMPLEQAELFENLSFRILDPSCGSGVFLVATYKRLLQWWAINHWRRTQTIAYPDKETAKLILERNIFGVDIEGVAALVTIFGLTTAFLDKLTPKEIWNDLTFQNLSDKNIKGKLNFIDWAKKAKNDNECFDLVIGNPPFNETEKGKITNQAVKELFGKEVPNNKLSLKFLEGALYFGKKVSMIIPSNVFLYNKNNNAHEYRKNIFTNYSVKKIHDFTHLRRNLFHKADTPVIALLLENKPSEFQSIEHIIVKREFFSEQKIRFEIDYYDKHQVRWDIAIDEKKHFVWKTNLLGGGRLFHLIYRLSLLETLGGFLAQKKLENPKWIYKRGYETEISSEEKNDKIISISEDGSYKIETLYFEPSAINPLPPFILIDQICGSKVIPVTLIEDYPQKHIFFTRDFLGIHAPIEEIDDLKKILSFFNEPYGSLYRLIAIVNSGSCLILTETEINKRDIDDLPFPNIEKYLNLTESERIIKNDVLDFYIRLGKAIKPNSDGNLFHTRPKRTDLENFGKVYCDVLNEIYAEDGNSWQIGEVLRTPTFIRYQFGFGKNGGLQKALIDIADGNLNTLFNNIKPNNGINYQRIIRYYDHKDGFDCVYLIKPTAKRYWLSSIALRDADDTFMDLKKNGL